ncbi:MAG TPA: hypothetical protein VG722_00655, partial [Tepidisphaeraceae bacterium]|nr:hypothetical protein [Tepidisphaeraceae bacterium]
IFEYLLITGPVQWTIGCLGLVTLMGKRCRADLRIIWILAITLMLILAVWVESVGNTSGGGIYSTRVLGPAMVVLSIAAAIGYLRLSRWPIAQAIWIYAILCILTIAGVYPFSSIPMPARQWIIAGRESQAPHRAQQAGILLNKIGFPKNRRILSSNAYLYVALKDDGYVVTPVWSPEVSFLFDPSVNSAQARRRLENLGIIAVDFDTDSIDTPLLNKNSPFFFHLYHNPRGYRPLIYIGGWGILQLPFDEPGE